MATRTQMNTDLLAIGVSAGSHTICMKNGHADDTSQFANGACTVFTSYSYTGGSVSGATYSSARPDYDLAFCGCIINEDCPSNFT